MGKVAYRIKNWKSYNQSLVNRGKVTVWLDEELLKKWVPTPVKKMGRPVEYSDAAVTFCYTIKSIFSLALRQCQGFVSSIFELSKIDLQVPHYSTLCKRLMTMKLPKISNLKKVKHVAIDATGLKVYGEGEWKMRIHGKEKRRTWRKIHISVDADSKEIIACVTTLANAHDSEKIQDVLEPLDKAEFVFGDGAYDTKSSYDAAERLGAHGVFPPRQGAVLSKKINDRAKETPRDINVLSQEFWGDKEWKELMRYGLRNSSENVFYRFKTIFGQKLMARTEVRQAFEVATKMSILNRFSAIGLPISYAVK